METESFFKTENSVIKNNGNTKQLMMILLGWKKKLKKLDNDIMANATNSGKLNELTKEKETAEALLEEKMDRWVYLNDLAEQIEAQNNK